MIEIVGLEKVFGDKILFSGASLRLGARERLGLVGPNGSGKTTLFRMIYGEDHPDRGEILLRKGAHIGFLSQEPAPLQGLSLLEEVQGGVKDLAVLEGKMRILREEIADEKDPQTLEALAHAYGQLEEKYARRGGYTLESQAKTILLGLGFKESDLGRSSEELSGGWLMRLSLAKILLASPDLLLLDEPTNHLDLESLIWLEEFLSDYLGSVMMVSHDRDFLNRVARKIASLEQRRIVLYPGNYDEYLRVRKEREALREAALENQRRKIEQTERFIERFRYKATKARQVQSRIKGLEKLGKIEVGETSKTIRFSFPQPARSGRVVVSLRGVHKGYGPVKVYSGIDLTIDRGEKIALVGVNGAGKSTLLKLLAGVFPPDQGTLEWGHNVSTAYFAQLQLELLDPSKTVWEEIYSLAKDESVSFLRGLLGAFLFSGEEIEKKVSVLSGGEKSRLVLAKMLMRPANFLLLDEPSNHLDIAAREVLESALREFEGTICLITHDRHLINAIANKVIEIDAGRLTPYLGNYDDYLYKKDLERGGFEKGEDGKISSANPTDRGLPGRKSKDKKRLEAEVRNRFFRETQDLRRRIQEIESGLDQASRDLQIMEKKLADPEVYKRGENIADLVRSHGDLKKKTADLTLEWDTLSLQLEEMERRREAQLESLGVGENPNSKGSS
ncbi:MAG: ATP-binding cassette domain-containing protein [Syntrophaceae bacterium]|nr:ATP-binding cassette domain-containing protein [Syntrophaceae bacterium]